MSALTYGAELLSHLSVECTMAEVYVPDVKSIVTQFANNAQKAKPLSDLDKILQNIKRSTVTKPIVSDQKLQNLMNDMYRKSARIWNGSTADAIRYEKATGRLIKWTDHSIKGEQYVNALNNWIKANPWHADLQSAFNVLDDLLSALNGL